MIALELLAVAMLGYIILYLHKDQGQDVVDYKVDPGSFLIDTSALVDGRIFNISNIGIDKDMWVVTATVVDELKLLADNKTEKFSHQRARASIALKKLATLNCVDSSLTSELGADDHLLEIARSTDAILVTLDKNLINQARSGGATVFNPDELRRELQPVVSSGNLIMVSILGKGPTRNSAIAEAEWGELVIVENGAKYIGKTRAVAVVAVKPKPPLRRIITRI